MLRHWQVPEYQYNLIGLTRKWDEQKEPEYDQNRITEQFQNCIVEAYVIEIFLGYSFTTVKGLQFRYAVNGNEIQINRKKKSVTKKG